MRSAVFIFILTFVSVAHAAPSGYSYVPNAEERRSDSNYIVVPDFPRMEIVKEDEGTPNPLYFDKLPDSPLKSSIGNHHFYSLQVRDLAIGADAVDLNGVALLPFAVSVKHSQGNASHMNLQQGTIEVEGTLLIYVSQGELKASVTHYYDSWWMERYGRTFWMNSEIDLQFARNIVKPMLESYFNADRSRIDALLKLRPQLTRP